MQPLSTRQRNTFFGFSPNEVLVLGSDGNLWLESGPWGAVPPARQHVDADVARFWPLGPNEIYVLGLDGNLWFESGPWGTVPPTRQPVDGNVAAFEPLNAVWALVLGKDGNLWLEEGPWGETVPPSRQWVDGDVADFQSLGSGAVYVLGNNGNLWLETAPFGTRSPIARTLVDVNVSAFQVIDAEHVFVQSHNSALWSEAAPWGLSQQPLGKTLVPHDVAAFQALPGGQVYYVSHQGGMGLMQDPALKEFGGPMVDDQVFNFQMSSDGAGYVLATDGTLWYETGPWGPIPPTRQQVDSHVAYPPYFSPLPVVYAPTPLVFNFWPNTDGLNADSTLTVDPSGACTFSGSFSPSNVATGLASFDVSFVVVLRDPTGTGFVFSASGNVPTEGSYTWNQSSTNELLAQHFDDLATAPLVYTDVRASGDVLGTLNGVLNTLQQVGEVVDDVVEVIEVVGAVLAA
jgi:hypothetical protein